MTDKPEKPERKMVNLDPYIAAVLENSFAIINKKRIRLNKPPLTYNALVGLAIESLTVQMGIDK